MKRSIFWDKGHADSWKSIDGNPLATCFLLVSCLSSSLTLKVEAKYFSEPVVDFQQITWRYIAEDGTAQKFHYVEIFTI
jgi:hypothetical protein